MATSLIPHGMRVCDCWRVTMIPPAGKPRPWYGVLLPVSENLHGVFPRPVDGSLIVLHRLDDAHLIAQRSAAGTIRVNVDYAGHVDRMGPVGLREFARPFDDEHLLFIDMVGAPIPATHWEPDMLRAIGR